LEIINFGGTPIGEGHPTLVIAEAGVNHNGKLSMALDLVRTARRIGANCIKFQVFRADEVVSEKTRKAPYQEAKAVKGETQLEMLSRLELSHEDFNEIKKLCDEIGIHFLASPGNPSDVKFLEEMKVDGYKLASFQLVEPAMLNSVSRTNKPIFLSTGMSNMGEIREAVKIIREGGNNSLILLQCTTSYPTDISEVNLRAMESMRESFNTVVGFSDHTERCHAAFVAVGLGARVVEKHFTLSKALSGPDHSSSLEPNEFENLISGIRSVEKALGSPTKEPTRSEVENIPYMRRSIVAASRIRAGQVINEGDLSLRRPATGLKPSVLPELIGRRARKDIPMGTQIDFIFLEQEIYKD